MAESHLPTKPSARTFRRRKQLEQDLDHITAEMYRRNRELAETNQTLSLLRAIDAIVLESPDSLKLVCDQITKAVTDNTEYPLIALITRSGADDAQLQLYGWSVKNLRSMDNFGLPPLPQLSLPATDWLKADSTSQTFTVGMLSASQIATIFGCSEASARLIKRRLPLKSLRVVKLIVRQHLVGLLVAGFYSEVAEVPLRDIELLDRLAKPIGVALDNRLLFEENRRVLVQLRHSNKRLQELDETKDDFISMASHQLRTPLTSVKGYLSLVLEGDAGAIKPSQRQLLTQAFASSQRMVYLISDLLNVSRLKTGKFIIDASPINLADTITDEVEQLKETAKSRDIKLVYAKPAHFPMLMFDETKIRQVIMNFMDNAIYYTKPKGRIKVELIDKPTTIELRVVDNGIGVPRAERPHLFTKFYRAGNARKARPDGTGLGLFMAKKVISAHGGAVIFESQEGKGSTFGFSFSKSKLALPPKPAPAEPVA